MNDTNCETEEREIVGSRIKVRKIKFNNKIIELIRFGDVAEIKKGMDSYTPKVFKLNNETRGSFSVVKKELIISEREIELFSEEEKINGVDPGKYEGRHIIPLNKGGKSDVSNGWLPNYYVPTQYFLDWRKEIVINKHYHRNKTFYFQKGLTFSFRGEYSPTFRIKTTGPFDANGSGIFPKLDNIALIGNLNSKFFKYLFKNYRQHTVASDVDQLKEVPLLFYKNQKIEDLTSKIIDKQKQNPRYDYMGNEQKEIDKLVYEMYGLNKDDIREVETWYARRYPKLARFCDVDQ